MTKKKHDTQHDGETEKPTIIDIDPKDVVDEDRVVFEDVEDVIAEPVQPINQPIKVKRAAAWPFAAGALALGLLGGGWFYKDVVAAYFPNDYVKGLEARVIALESSNKSYADADVSQDRMVAQLSTDVDALEVDVGQGKSNAVELTSRIDKGLSAQEQKIAALEKSLASAGAEITKLKAMPLVSSSGGTVDPAVLASLGARLDALEKDLASLKSAKSGSEDTAVLSQSLSDLKAKLAGGVAYAAELSRVRTLVPAAEGYEDLERYAASGITTAQGLGAELRAAAPSLPLPAAVSTPSSDDGYLARVSDFFSNLVTIKTVGEENWQELAEKAASLSESGALSEAIALIDKAPGAKPAALTAWRERASGRLSADQAIGLVSDAVTRHLLAKGQ